VSRSCGGSTRIEELLWRPDPALASPLRSGHLLAANLGGRASELLSNAPTLSLSGSMAVAACYTRVGCSAPMAASALVVGDDALMDPARAGPVPRPHRGGSSAFAESSGPAGLRYYSIGLSRTLVRWFFDYPHQEG
jgi:hypothetical protein